MVLSGFIFTYGAFGHKIHYFNFIKNRLLRIYPLFILLTMVGIYTYPDKFTFISFFQTIFCFSNSPGSLSIGPLSAMFWAISVEFQFYLLFPFIMTFLEKYKIKKLISIILIAILFRFISYLLGSNIRNVSYWSIIGRIDQFIIGMLVANFFTNMKENVFSKKYSIALFIFSTTFIITILFIFNKLGGWPSTGSWKILWPTIEGSAWGIFLLSYILMFNNKKNIFFSMLSKLGELSFSIYMLHYTIIQIICDKNLINFFSTSPFKNAIINTTLIVLPITILISILTYNSVEKPFLDLRVKYLE